MPDLLAEQSAWSSLAGLTATFTGEEETGEDRNPSHAGSGISFGDLNGDGIDDLAIGSWRDNTIYIVFGRAPDGPGSLDLSELDPSQGLIIRTPHDGIAGPDASGDFNGDGYDDLLFGAPDVDDAGRTTSGRVYVVFGSAAGPATSDPSALAPEQGFHVTGRTDFASNGAFVQWVGDMNGDGFDDAVMAGRVSGYAFVLFGRPDGFHNVDLAAPHPTDGFAIRGGRLRGGAGDFNGDGMDDLAFTVGATTPFGGAVRILFGHEGEFSTVDVDAIGPAESFVITGLWQKRIASAGDVNGDGFDDMLVCAQDGYAVRAYVVFGRATVGSVDLAALAPEDGFFIQATYDDLWGIDLRVAGAGDVNADGYADVLIGAPRASDRAWDPISGNVYLVFGHGGSFQNIDLNTFSSDQGFVIVGSSNVPDTFYNSGFGQVLAGNGDFNADGFDDVAVGAPNYEDPVGDYVGLVAVAYGQLESTGLVRTGSTRNDVIRGGAGHDRLDGLGGDDTLHGFGGDDYLAGAAGEDRLLGLDGNDRLDGGAAADRMRGGLGDDSYVVDNALDKAIENAGEGTDEVTSSVSRVLGAQVENLVLSGSGAINGTGNGLANILTGNAGANRLNGGYGVDIMNGGGGDDVYIVDDPRDRAVESAGGGSDEVRSSASFRLGSEIETLTLTGTAAINGTGNAGGNHLIGNNAANLLDGATGADEMRGGKGNDTYIVDNVGDQAIEISASHGFDTVNASVTFTLGAKLENLILTGIGSIDGTGNRGANVITGNSAKNFLDGGTGSDTLFGGGGDDRFVFANSPSATNVDAILDFAPGSDRILLDDAVFTALSAGALPAGALVMGSAATDANDRVLYDAATGALYYDRDGTGAAAAVQFATLDNMPVSLAASDFLVI